MNDNPYHPPRIAETEEASKGSQATEQCPTCPECNAVMESGYIASSASLYWRQWTNQRWLLRGNESLAKTGSVFGINKLSGFRCAQCEIVIFAYGGLRGRFSPEPKSD